MTARPSLDVVLPVHNEARSIAATLRGVHQALSAVTECRLIVAEDASRDGTREIIDTLKQELPMIVDSSVERRGYSGAMLAGLRCTDAPWVMCVDSDAQYVPADMVRLWQTRDRADVTAGWRVRRAEGALRRVGSAAFGALLRAAFPVPLHDPSCSLVLMRRPVLVRLLPVLGDLPEGFWWEFEAKAHQHGFTQAEVPIAHQPRPGGGTRVYGAASLPGVVWRQIRGLARMARAPVQR